MANYCAVWFFAIASTPRATRPVEVSTVQSAAGARPAGWFGNFDEAESTYDYDGTFAHRNENPQIDVMDGWNPHQDNPFVNNDVSAEWFEESKSGGYKQAWQTFYPALKTVPGNRVPTGSWYSGTGGIWQQSYQSPNGLGQQGPEPGWFDEIVNQVDGFGREKSPALGSPRNYLYWEERSVNTTLSCKEPGCTANVSLHAPFNGNKDLYKFCKLSVMFHPTDFDDLHSGESVEWVQVNNRVVSSNCHPFAAGCNQSASRPLLPCVDAIPVDQLMPENGVLTIAAKIPKVVDECPYKGNLLSAVPMLTCLVAPKSVAMPQRHAKTVPYMMMGSSITTMPLQCPTRGCAALIDMPINSTQAKLGKCLLTVTVKQTDYDNADGTPETIEYIKVDERQVASNLKPGHNPCKSAWHGDSAAASAPMFTAVKDLDVTRSIQNGRLRIEGKISPYVDECDSHGNLFDAVAEVRCSPTSVSAKTALLSRKKKVPLLGRKLKGGVRRSEAADASLLPRKGPWLLKMLTQA